ncbi:AMP-binding protein [Pseudomonas sp. SP16.1]|uniref:AMP-binding protein n=1 Tax=Pseudomonas sp. SP16.1 TaxID=3458854 RepID=UPI0040459C99
MRSAAESLFARLAEFGPQTALAEGERTLTYAELLGAVAARSERLQRLDARRVALALDNGIDWVLWDLATLHAGLVCVPLPAFFSAEQQRHVLGSAGIDCLIGAPAPGFASVADGIQRRAVAQPATLHPGTCKITYTSGTTGQPKGVCLDLASQLAVAASLVEAGASREVQRHLCVLPLATLLENIAGVYAPLMAGARVELMAMARIGLSGASGLDLPRLLQALQAAQPHSLILLPQLLLALVGAAERGMPLPASLRFVAVGGGRVSAQLLQRAEALGLPVFEGYGLSECASVVCLNTPEQRRIGSTGKPLGHLQVRLAEDGEVLVKGARMLGYLGEPAPAGDWLGTGDLGHCEDGFLVLHGRKKHQFITAYGRNVNPEWVEAELVQQLPIAQAWLHGEALPGNVAVLVPRFADTAEAQLQAAVDAVNRGLPDYARVHHWLRADEPFSAANGLATTNGRLRRTALFDLYQAAITELMAEGVQA